MFKCFRYEIVQPMGKLYAFIYGWLLDYLVYFKLAAYTHYIADFKSTFVQNAKNPNVLGYKYNYICIDE